MAEYIIYDVIVEWPRHNERFIVKTKKIHIEQGVIYFIDTDDAIVLVIPVENLVYAARNEKEEESDG